MSHVDVYGRAGGGETVHNTSAASMHLDSRAAAQVSELPDRDGFLIRVWGPDQLHEYGGGNLHTVSLIVRYVDGVAVLEKFDFDAAAGAREITPDLPTTEGEQ